MSAIAEAKGSRQDQRQGLATIEQAGEYLGLKRSSIYRLLENESLKRVQIPKISAVRISWDSIYAVANGTAE